MKLPAFLFSLFLTISFITLTQQGLAASTGNISTADKYAWSEKSGWINFRPSDGGIMVTQTFLSGYAWGENIGWIKLGSDAVGPYGNTTNIDWGVNMDGSGILSGYAWSETAGWINFKPTNGGVNFDNITGAFSGYAWAENVGWMHFDNTTPAYNVKTVQHALSLNPASGGGISCVSSAPEGWNVTCSIIPLSEYYIQTLTDNGTPITDPTATYQITGINIDHTISATFVEYMVKRIFGAQYEYDKTIAEAYGNVTTDWERILLKSYGTFAATDFNQAKKVSFEGGYGAGFSSNTGAASTIPGSMTITDGTLSVSNITIQQ